MAIDPTKAFEVENGISFGGGVSILSDNFNPAVVGLDAILFSRYYRDNGETWVKNGAGVNDWLLLASASSVSASPPFEYYRDEITSAGEYLLCGGMVPSNTRGRPVPISNGQLVTAFVSSKKIDTYNVDVEVRTDPGGIPTFTHLTTFSVSGTRKVTIPITGANLNLGDELVMKISSGSVEDVLIGVIIFGQT